MLGIAQSKIQKGTTVATTAVDVTISEEVKILQDLLRISVDGK